MLRPLGAGDPLWPDFVATLEQDRLATADLDTPDQFFFVHESDQQVDGYGGYALLGGAVFLRSIVTRHERRGRGIGQSIVRTLLDRAGADGAREAWLLTTDAASFFDRMGFAATSRSDAPPVIANTPQFRGVCPGSATLMHLSLPA